MPYNGSTRRHQNCKMCQVITAAWGVGFIRVYHFTAVQRPVAVHGIRQVVPKCTLTLILICGLKKRHFTDGKKRKSYTYGIPLSYLKYHFAYQYN